MVLAPAQAPTAKKGVTSVAAVQAASEGGTKADKKERFVKILENRRKVNLAASRLRGCRMLGDRLSCLSAPHGVLREAGPACARSSRHAVDLGLGSRASAEPSTADAPTRRSW